MGTGTILELTGLQAGAPLAPLPSADEIIDLTYKLALKNNKPLDEIAEGVVSAMLERQQQDQTNVRVPS